MAAAIAPAIVAAAALALCGWLVWRARHAQAELVRQRQLAQAAADLFWEAGSDGALHAHAPDLAPSLAGCRTLAEIRASLDPMAAARLDDALDRQAPFRDVMLAGPGPDGQRCVLALAGTPIFASSRFSGYRGTARIATQAAELEFELAEKTAELDQLRQRLADFTALSADWLWEEDSEHRLVYLQRPTRDTLTPIEHSFIGLRRWERGIDVALDGDMEAHKADLAARREFRDFRLRRALPDGTDRIVSVSGRPIFGQDGAFRGYRGTSKDITVELAEAERAHISERRLLRALDSLRAAIAVFDRMHQLVFYNRAYRDRLGLGDALQIGKTYEELLETMFARARIGPKGDPRATWTDELARVDAGEASMRTIAYSDGSTVDRRLQPLDDGGFAVIAVDVTQERARAKEIAEKTQILESTIENIDEGIIVYNGETKLVVWNDTARRMLEIPPEFPLTGSDFATNIRFQLARGDLGPVDDIEADIARRLARNREPVASISEGWRKNGRYIQTRRSPLPDGGWVTLLLDLTERRETEEALRRAKEAAEAANRAKSDFLAHMSHELRTPLNAVIGFSEIIFREIFGTVGEPRYADYARDIHASGTHLLNVISDILDISKAESGSAELDEEKVDVAELAAASLRLVEPRATVGKVRVVKKLAPDLPDIRADARRLKQVLLNLLSNAVKFTPPGGHVELEARVADDAGVQIVVHDTGIGMDPKDIPRALEPFAQVDNALSRRFEGTGLGLPLSRKLVELHGGTLTIASEIAKGTSVVVHLPPNRTLARVRQISAQTSP
jgi:signal transduction histidine kinase